jgi:hypothetical protein
MLAKLNRVAQDAEQRLLPVFSVLYVLTHLLLPRE